MGCGSSSPKEEVKNVEEPKQSPPKSEVKPEPKAAAAAPAEPKHHDIKERPHLNSEAFLQEAEKVYKNPELDYLFAQFDRFHIYFLYY